MGQLCFAGCHIEENVNYWGNDLFYQNVETQQACADLAVSVTGGNFWTWNRDGNKGCHIKKSRKRVSDKSTVSGNRLCGKVKSGRNKFSLNRSTFIQKNVHRVTDWSMLSNILEKLKTPV